MPFHRLLERYFFLDSGRLEYGYQTSWSRSGGPTVLQEPYLNSTLGFLNLSITGLTAIIWVDISKYLAPPVLTGRIRSQWYMTARLLHQKSVFQCHSLQSFLKHGWSTKVHEPHLKPPIRVKFAGLSLESISKGERQTPHTKRGGGGSDVVRELSCEPACQPASHVSDWIAVRYAECLKSIKFGVVLPKPFVARNLLGKFR